MKIESQIKVMQNHNNLLRKSFNNFPKTHTALGIEWKARSEERARTWNGKPDPKGNAQKSIKNLMGVANR